MTVTAVSAAPVYSVAGAVQPFQGTPGARADDGAHVVATKQLAAHVVDLTIDSPAMGKNMPVRVILPLTWSSGTSSAFPTVYLLQGASDDYTSWTRETDIEDLAAPAQVIVAMPEGGRAGFYTNWWNYGEGKKGDGENWETFHTAELPQILERGYHANTRRAVIGLSEGGLGALDYTARHPGRYVFAGSFSGVDDLSDPALRIGIALTCLREGVDPVRLWGDRTHNRDVWNAHDPSRMVTKFRGVKVHLSAATGQLGPLDANAPLESGPLEAPTYQPTARFAAALRAAGVDVTSHLYATGTHTWPYWERELHLAWPAVLSALQVTP